MAKLKFFRRAGIGLLVVGLAMVIGALLFQKQIAEVVISRIIGREANISGDMDVRLGPVSGVRVTQLTIGNASWATHDYFLKAKTAELSIDLASLWRNGTISVQLDMASPGVYLERSRTGQVNWHAASDPKGASGVAPFNAALGIQNGLISYIDHAQPDAVELHIDHLDAQIGTNRTLKVESTGRLLGQVYQLRANGNAWGKHYAADHPYPFKLNITTDTARFILDGSIARPLQMSGMDANVSLEGENLAALASLKDNANLEQRFKVAGHLSGSARRWAFSNFTGYLGKSDFRGDMTVDLSHEGPSFKGRLAIDELNTRLINVPASQWSGAMQNDETTQRVMLQNVAAFTASAHVRIERIVGGAAQIGPVEFDLVAGNGVIAIDTLCAAIGDGMVRGRMHYKTEDEMFKGTVALQLNDVPVGPVLRVLSRMPTRADLFDGSVDGKLTLQFSATGVEEATGQLQYGAPLTQTSLTVDVGRRKIAGQWWLHANAKGKVRGLPVKAVFTGQPFDLLEAQGAAWPFSLRGAIAKSSVNVEGYLTGTGRAFDIEMRLSGPGTKALSTLTGMSLPSLPTYEISAKVVREPDLLKLSRLDVRIGHSDLSGSVTLVRINGISSAKIDVRAGTIRYKDFDQLRTVGQAGNHWMAKLDDLRANISVKAARIIGPGGILFEDVLLKALLQDDLLKLEPFRFRAANGTVDIHAVVRKRATRILGGTLEAKIKHVDMGEALKPLALGDNIPGSLSADIQLGFGPDAGNHATKSTLTYGDERTGSDLAFVFQQSKDGLNVKGRGVFLKEPFSLGARAGSLEDLFSGKPYPFDMRLHVLQTDVELDGHVRKPLELVGLQSTLVIAGPDPRKIAPIVGFQTPELPPYRLKGKLSHQNGTWRFAEINGKVGDSDLDGEIVVFRDRQKPLVRAQLHSDHLDFDDLASVIGAPPDTKREETSNVDQRRRADVIKDRQTVLPVKALEFSVLSDFDADIGYSAGTVDSDTLPLDSLRLKLSLDGGRLLLKPTLHTKAGGTISAEVQLVAGPEGHPANGHAEVRISEVSLGAMLERYTSFRDSWGKINGALSVRTRGRSIAEMLGAMDGSGTLTMSDGALDALIVELGGLDGGEALLLWLGDERLVKVRCAKIEALANNGVVQLGTAVIDTTDTKFTMQGKIGFASETFDLLLKAHPKDISMFVARVPFVIEGSFKRPEFHPSWGHLLLRGAAAVLLGAINPPAALLALVEPGLGDDAQCADLSN